MYNYEFDEETGGVILTDKALERKRELTPVFSQEMDLFGFDKQWTYEKRDDVPYMWKSIALYYYRGKKVARVIGGGAYAEPTVVFRKKRNGTEILPKGTVLEPIDIPATIKKNEEKLKELTDISVKQVKDVYAKQKDRVEVVYVAFSGGKDSCVLLDICKKGLDKDSFYIMFSDTDMESKYTYELVDQVSKECKEEGYKFYTASPNMPAEVSWKEFGPPSKFVRWCCSVHKSTTSVLGLRKIVGKHYFTSLAFIGVRKLESWQRASYTEFSESSKVNGQSTHYPILEWSSLEVWLYMFKNNLPINTEYLLGESRVGCVVCPMQGNLSIYIALHSEGEYLRKIYESIYSATSRPQIPKEEFLQKGVWVARRNGEYLADNPYRYKETRLKDKLVIEVLDPKTDWKEWIKILGELSYKDGVYNITFRDKIYRFTVEGTEKAYVVTLLYDRPFRNFFKRYFKFAFRRAAYCVKCGTCEANCLKGAIHFDEKGVTLDGCVSCLQCALSKDGCLAYHSLHRAFCKAPTPLVPL